VQGGKNEDNNDELVSQAQPTDTLLHTKASGSPFVNVGKTPTKKELYEAAIFCAAHSQDWRDRQSNVTVHSFLRANMRKDKTMKVGTWEVTKHAETIMVKKMDIERYNNTRENLLL